MVIRNEPVTCEELMKRFPQSFTEIVGDAHRPVKSVSAPDSALADSIIFMATPKALASGLESAASAWVVSPKFKSQALEARGDRTVLISPNVEMTMARVIDAFFLKTPYTNHDLSGVHSSAHVAPTATIGQGSRIGPGAFIADGVRIGSGSYVGANSVIESDAQIGDQTVIHPLVFIGHSVRIGNQCEIHPNTTIGKEGYGYAHDEKGNHVRIPHQGPVVIEDDVHIGASCTIDRATFDETRIERGAKLDNQVHVGHNCRIGRNALITAGFRVAGSSSIGANFVTGGNSVVTGHIEICDNVQLAGVSAVTKSITKPGQYGGHPLLPLQEYLKMKVAMTRLPELLKVANRLSTQRRNESESES